jgi:penicillin-binding protein 1A
MDERVESSPGSFKLPGGGRWNVSNATEGGGGGRISLYEAITHSVNAVFARLILDVGATEVAGLAESMGITTPLNDDPAIALGGMRRGVTPLEMASAYGTLATRGFRYPPVAIQMVKGASGRVISRARPIGQPVLDGTVCALETEALENVIREGTGRRAQIGRPAAGKTGTTQNYADAWFVGYTPQLVTSVWVGYPQGQRPMYDVHGRRVAGGTFPAEIWARFMTGALAGVPEQGFRRPAKNVLVSARVCDVTNLLITKYCPRPVTARFQVGHVPEKVCGVHTNPSTVAVPRVLGMQVGEATEMLVRLGFVAVPTYVRSKAPLGTVLEQTPHAGQTAAYGSLVAVQVSAGSEDTSADQPPRATFTVSTTSPRVGEAITLDGTASSDAEGPVAQWSWSFGDGEGGSGSRVIHSYRSSGQYQPVLTVYDGAGHAVSVLGPIISVRP